MIAALARPPFARLVRAPRAWIPVAGWVLVGMGLALAARFGDSGGTADQIAPGPLGGLVIPLLTYATVGGLLGGGSLRGSMAPVLSFGASPWRAATVTVGLAVVVCASLSALVGAAAVCTAHGAGDPPLAWDALTTAYACALGGAAYAALFVLGATLGRRGAGRPLLLVADWIFGRGDGLVSALTPRGHLRSLLAGPVPFELSPRASVAAIVALSVVFAAVAIRRAGR